MRNHTHKLVSAICLSILLSTGCATTAPGLHPVRTPAEREQLIKPGELGGAADGRRWLFDFWNAQVVREDAPVSTVFLGDSITDFWNIPVYLSSDDGIIVNRGIGGDVASVMAKRFQADVVQLRPRNVIILAGTNDVTIMLGEKKAQADIIRDVTASIESMMGQARAAGINTLVCSILPTNANYPSHDAGKQICVTINENIKAACAAKGCIYIDYASQLGDEAGDLRKDLAYDGIHPNYAGYEIMTRMLKKSAAKHGLQL